MSNCFKCGSRLRAIDKYCNECGEKTPQYVISKSPSQNNPTMNQTIIKHKQKIPLQVNKHSVGHDNSRQILWLGIIIFLLAVSKGHSWHNSNMTWQTSDENFRGNYTDITEVELYHDLQGWRFFTVESRDYIGVENDTSESSGSYYEINSEWIDQSNYRTSIFVKQITTFLVNIAILFTIIGTIIVVSRSNSPSGMSYVRKLSFCAGIVIIAALSFFTLTFTPFSEDDTTSEQTEIDCLAGDSIGVGSFGSVEFTDCANQDFDLYSGKFVPGLGFFETLICGLMSLFSPFMLKTIKR